MLQNHSDSNYGKILREFFLEKNHQPHDSFKVMFSATDSLVLDIFSLRRRKAEEKESLNQNLDKYYESIYFGCSETHGSHIASKTLPLEPGNLYPSADLSTSYDYIWGSIVCNHLGGEFLNLGVGGASAISILDDYMYQVKKYGAPKNLFILYPRIDTRLPLVNDPDILISKPADKEFIDLNEYTYATQIGEDATYLSLSKRPHAVQSVISGLYASYLNLQAILTMELLSDLLHTNFVYSTWSLETSSLIEAANMYAEKNLLDIPFKNYIKVDYKSYGNDCVAANADLPLGCHQDLKNHPRYYIGEGNTHMGVHAHRHVAENFIQELTKRGYTASL